MGVSKVKETLKIPGEVSFLLTLNIFIPFELLVKIILLSSLDFISIIILLECIAFSSYVLVGFERKNKFSTSSALKYLILAAIPSGFFILGVIPGGICVLFLPSVSLADYGLTIIPATTLFSFVSFLALLVIVFPIIYISAKNPKNFSNYPQIRSKIWNKKILSIKII
jgi:formate hydrogenlyase subunit 3/multisubunit Na+/H+ antiporter MnhD subunit